MILLKPACSDRSFVMDHLHFVPVYNQQETSTRVLQIIVNIRTSNIWPKDSEIVAFSKYTYKATINSEMMLIINALENPLRRHYIQDYRHDGQKYIKPLLKQLVG